MKKTFFSFLVMFFLVPSFALCATKEDWVIDDFDSTIVIHQDGIVSVKETINADFGALEKHGIFRLIPVEYTTSDNQKLTLVIEGKPVTDGKSDIPYKTEYVNGNLRLQIGDPNKIISGKQTYVIEYTVRGALREFDAYDELYWNITGNEWPVPIKHVSASFSIPEGEIMQSACYFGITHSAESCSASSSVKSITLFSTSKTLKENEGMTIAAGFTKGIVPILLPLSGQNSQPDFFVDFNVLRFLVSFLVTLIICLSVIFKAWEEKGRDKKSSGEKVPLFEKSTIIAEYESPLGLRPGEIGVLVDETADTLDITATIVDLAVRGYLIIEEIPKKWFLGSTDYAFTKTAKSEGGLLSYEKTLVSSLFKNRQKISASEIFNFLSLEAKNAVGTKEETVKISDLRNSFYQDLLNIKKELYDTVTRKKLFEDNPQSVRTKYSLFATGMIIAGFVIPFFFWKINTGVFSGIGVGLMISGIIFMIVAIKAMSKKTPLGYDTKIKAEGYKLFISETEKHRAAFYEKENMFMEVLPYAIVFGVTDKLANAMKEIGMNQAQPTWYHGNAPFNAALFATGMNDFSKSLGTALASAPGGSGSGGGGFSGGGFGGGGGGSW